MCRSLLGVPGSQQPLKYLNLIMRHHPLEVFREAVSAGQSFFCEKVFREAVRHHPLEVSALQMAAEKADGFPNSQLNFGGSGEVVCRVCRLPSL